MFAEDFAPIILGLLLVPIAIALAIVVDAIRKIREIRSLKKHERSPFGTVGMPSKSDLPPKKPDVTTQPIEPEPPTEKLPPMASVAHPSFELTEARLDVAVPESVQVAQTFDLAVTIRQLSSDVLQEQDLPQVRSGMLQIAWTPDEPSIQLIIRLDAPDCEIQGSPRHSLTLYRHHDSPVHYFHLTPKKEGLISIIVTVYQYKSWLGSARVHTKALPLLAGQVETHVISQSLHRDELLRLHGNLIQHFNLEELRMLCFSLDIQHEEFTGTLSPFARELIVYCARREMLRQLIKACKEARPHVYWQTDRIPTS